MKIIPNSEKEHQFVLTAEEFNKIGILLCDGVETDILHVSLVLFLLGLVPSRIFQLS